ncbi:MAG: hypothetical protein COA58_13015 [Bacteroidetes bacterium]|nr:MAG: hypothetical protein COA58_13015 [Bacteroidota bacterium]
MTQESSSEENVLPVDILNKPDSSFSLIDTIDLSEYIKRIDKITDVQDYIASFKDSSKLSIQVTAKNIDSTEYVRIQYGRDDPLRFFPAYNFFVNPENRKIYYYLGLEDSLIDISNLRENQLPFELDSLSLEELLK